MVEEKTKIDGEEKETTTTTTTTTTTLTTTVLKGWGGVTRVTGVKRKKEEKGG